MDNTSTNSLNTINKEIWHRYAMLLATRADRFARLNALMINHSKEKLDETQIFVAFVSSLSYCRSCCPPLSKAPTPSALGPLLQSAGLRLAQLPLPINPAHGIQLLCTCRRALGRRDGT